MVYKKLPDLCYIQYGYAFDSSKFSESEGVPLVRIRDVVRGYSETYTTERCGDEYIVQNGDMLIGMDGEFNIARWKGGKAYLNQRVCRLIPKEDVETLYLFYFMPTALKAIEEKTPFVTVKHLSARELNKVVVPVPSVEEQKRIAEKMKKVDDLIAFRQEQLAKLDELVKSRFIELFGDPVLNQHGWQKAALEANATLLNGRAYKQDELLDSGKYPVLRVGNFFSNRGWYYSDLELDDDKYCDTGDLLYAWSASFGPQIWNGGKVIYHYHIWKVLVGEAYNKQFLCKLLEYATESLMGDTHGIAMMHLTKSGMEKTEFIVPPIELQEQFAAFVEQIDKSKLAIQESLAELETLKKALMQQYFG